MNVRARVCVHQYVFVSECACVFKLDEGECARTDKMLCYSACVSHHGSHELVRILLGVDFCFQQHFILLLLVAGLHLRHCTQGELPSSPLPPRVGLSAPICVNLRSLN